VFLGGKQAELLSYFVFVYLFILLLLGPMQDLKEKKKKKKKKKKNLTNCVVFGCQVDDLLAMQSCNLMCLPENYQMKVSSTLLVTFCTDDSMVAGLSLAVWNLFKDYFFSLFLSHFALKKFSACLQHNTIIAVYTTIAGALQVCPSVL